MSLRVFVPQDTTAIALGADRVAAELQAQLATMERDVTLVRNGSRGAFWLEPLVEIECEQQRFLVSNMESDDVPLLLSALANESDSLEHCLKGLPGYLGSAEHVDYLARQHRVTFARSGLEDPLDLDAYRRLQGISGLERALTLAPQAIVDEITQSGLRGRGGAAFPAGIKWQTVLDTKADQKYIVCNADEGDSGTFADRLLMESDPFQLLEGMIIAGLAVEATQGYIYLRSEYPRAHVMLNAAIEIAKNAGLLGTDILGSGRSFSVEVRLGAGAYICGEETSLLESLEGKRPVVRAKPPLPAVAGLFGQPTVVNNVLTLAAASSVLAQGGPSYAELGNERSRGTLTVQLAGNVKCGGLVEIPFGRSLRELLDEFAGGTASGRPLRAVQVGGPLGAYLPESLWDTPLDYEAFAQAGAMLGHGGVVMFDSTVDMQSQARFAMAFCAAESCGKCTPCRIGSVRGVEVIDRIIARESVAENVILLNDLCDTLEYGSLCAMGGLTPNPVRSALAHFGEDFE
ncbi:NADH-ubiquinone oxidoreductase-F iron-sulfur binding region domain-containing protein [Marinobacter alexandrii]|uniref:NADH-ubiquinone oxidoreductase-F iron-sulfur binding region domain-containing protein n=1 Tax=Marinobacter alexandrii TaxID=2570351 RepID=UPI00329A141C